MKKITPKGWDPKDPNKIMKWMESLPPQVDLLSLIERDNNWRNRIKSIHKDGFLRIPSSNYILVRIKKR